MACRCSDISRCKSDIDILGGTILPKLKAAKTNCSDATTALDACGDSFTEALCIPNLYTTAETLRTIENKASLEISDLYTFCNNEIQRLSNRLTSLRHEDNSYHAEQNLNK